jgi:septin family protein
MNTQQTKSDSLVASGSGSRQEISSVSAVFVVGPSSSGKTTLCNTLAEKVKLDPARHIKEVARTVMRTHSFSRHTVKTYEMQHTIMLAQVKEEQRVLQMPIDETKGICLLSDRSAVDPIVYASTSGLSEADAMRESLMREPAFLNALTVYRKALFSKSS